MNRIWIFLCFLCIPWAARGQSAYEWRYWFDDAKSQQQTGQGSGEAFSIAADAAALDEGLHAIHVQITDTAGRFSPPLSQLFYRVGDRTVKRLRCWFDTDRDIISTAPIAGSHATLDVNHLEPGLHFVYCQAEDAMGNVSDVASAFFYRPMRTEKATWSYWFDDDREARQTVAKPDGPVLIDVSALADGFHTIYQQVSEKTPSAVVSRWFIKVPQTEGSADMTCICTVNEKLVSQQRVPSKGGVISWDLDVSALPVGLHRAVFQVITASGAASTIAERFFVRAITPAEVGQMKCVYTLDNSATKAEAGTMAGGLFHFDLDVSALEDGLHRIAYMMVAEDGSTTPQQTAFFWKTPVGGNGIVQYDYWLNDEEQALRSVHLDKRENPFRLISLLPIDAQPIRSSSFHFEVVNGQPTIYAKNDLHIRFYDTAARCLSDTRQFVDYQVGQKVTDVETLVPGVQTTTAKPADNKIKWYCLEAEKGDSLAFRTDRPCTLQLFSPTGEEIYAVSGSNALNYGGSYAPTDGTYYLALHDVTAKNCSSLNVDYLHTDKYAVLSYTPSDLGVLPAAQVVHLSGNGYDKMTAATLRLGDKRIVAEEIYTGGKTETDLMFVLQGNEAKGSYDLVLSFEDEGVGAELVVPEAISLSVPDFSDFEIKITDPRTVDRPYPVSISITNKGNLTYSNVPFFMAYDNVARINDVSFINVDVVADTALVNGGLKFVYNIDDFKGKGIKANMIPTIIPILRPGETQTFKLGFQTETQSSFNVYAWAGTPWSLYANETMTAIQSLAASGTGFTGGSGSGSGSGSGTGSVNGSGSGSGGTSSSGSGGSSGSGSGSGFVIYLPGSGSGGNGSGGVGTSCMPNPCDIGGLFSDLLGCLCGTYNALANTLGGIKKALYNNYARGQSAQLQRAGLSEWDDFPQLPLQHPGDIFNDWASDCLPGKIGMVVDTYNTAMDMLGNEPCPDPDPHPCNPPAPFDPNDIYGYMAESGSKYMKEGTTDVYYTIEFENDPKFANASAHTIVVKDTLDTSRFDLSTFAAKSVKIGSAEMELDGEKSFSKRTVDLRPDIDVIAQVSLSLDEKKGIATWTIESLDPMSMEPTTDAMQGVLPVNTNGNGQGELTFDIKLKPGMVEDDSVCNRAAIVFDQEGTIMTPTWTNTVDATPPVSRVVDATILTDSTACVSIDATDNMSGLWRYDVYQKSGSVASWQRVAVNVPADSMAVVAIKGGVEHHFYCVATDMAGNVEQKEPRSEVSFYYGDRHKGDVNGDGKVSNADLSAVIYAIAGTGTETARTYADVNGDGIVNVADIVEIIGIMAAKSAQ